MVPQLIIAAVIFVVLIFVVARLIRVGCRLLVFLFYFALLAVAASLLYSLLQGTDVMRGFGQ